jgi:hypothetical protein
VPTEVIEGKAAAEAETTEVANMPAAEPMVFSPDED